jgi:hypothetical protein
MAEKQVVRCVQECWDSKRNRHYVRGDQDSIDPLEPVAKYFEGWAPGTEVYCKIPGTKTTPAMSSTRIIPGMKAEPKPETENEKSEVETADELDVVCGYCNQTFKSKAGRMAHQRFCEAALQAGIVEQPAQPEG